MRFRLKHISNICTAGIVIVLAVCTIVEAVLPAEGGFGPIQGFALADEDVSRSILRQRREKKTSPAPPVEKIDTAQQQTKKEELQRPVQYNEVKEPLPGRPIIEAEARCKLRPKSIVRPDPMLSATWQNLRRIPQRPSQLGGLPKDLSGQVSYFLAKFGGKEIPAIIDSAEGYRSYFRLSSSRQRHVLYLDTDGDNDLSDEKGLVGKPMRASRFGGIASYKFGPILIEFGGPEGKVKAEVCADTYSGGQLSFYPSAYLTGTIHLDKNKYDVAVIDGNFDGRYDKTVSIPVENIRTPGCDFFAVDLNGDRRFDYNPYRLSDIGPLSRMIKIKDVYYSIEVADDGSFLELKKAAPQFGALELGGADVTTVLLSDAAHQYLVGVSQQWQLPTGKYTARFLELSRTDSTGSRWTIKGYGETGKLNNFEIRPGEALSLKIGPPLLVKTTAERKDDDILIGVDLQGQSGEQYGAQIMRNGRPLPAPKFKIVNESGRELTVGEFKYG